MSYELYEDIYSKGFKVKIISKTTDNQILLEIVESSLDNLKVGTNYLIPNNSFEKSYQPCKKIFKVQRVVGVFQYVYLPKETPYCMLLPTNNICEVGKIVGNDKCIALIPIEKEIEL